MGSAHLLHRLRTLAGPAGSLQGAGSGHGRGGKVGAERGMKDGEWETERGRARGRQVKHLENYCSLMASAASKAR